MEEESSTHQKNRQEANQLQSSEALQEIEQVESQENIEYEDLQNQGNMKQNEIVQSNNENGKLSKDKQNDLEQQQKQEKAFKDKNQEKNEKQKIVRQLDEVSDVNSQKENTSCQQNSQTDQGLNINTSEYSDSFEDKQKLPQILNFEQQNDQSSENIEFQFSLNFTPERICSGNKLEYENGLENMKSSEEISQERKNYQSTKQKSKKDRDILVQEQIRNDARQIISKYIKQDKQIYAPQSLEREFNPQNSRSRLLNFKEEQRAAQTNKNSQEKTKSKSKLQQKLEEKLIFKIKKRKETSQDSDKLLKSSQIRFYNLAQSTNNAFKALGRTESQRFNLHCIQNYLGLTPSNRISPSKKELNFVNFQKKKRFSLSNHPSDRLMNKLSITHRDKIRRQIETNPNLYSPKSQQTTQNLKAQLQTPLKIKLQEQFKQFLNQKPNHIYNEEKSSSKLKTSLILQQKKPEIQISSRKNFALDNFSDYGWSQKASQKQFIFIKDKNNLQEEMHQLQQQKIKIQQEINEIQEKESNLEQQFLKKFKTQTQDRLLQSYSPSRKHDFFDSFKQDKSTNQLFNFTESKEKLSSQLFTVNSQSSSNFSALKDSGQFQQKDDFLQKIDSKESAGRKMFLDNFDFEYKWQSITGDKQMKFYTPEKRKF